MVGGVEVIGIAPELRDDRDAEDADPDVEEEFNEDVRKLKMVIINDHIMKEAYWERYTLPTSLKNSINNKNSLKMRELS